ncbi:MAG TPA: FKBP-type peptidyl-prolyl cis-trans isomerase [Methanoregulaceae archaeon]|nr:MAG: FKBP-type peptidyl-prolyl cis-trans isomerase [Methanolinea sp.]HON80831.1 FKBP-type peptidyl-prolyl cis-trans isomerase [Methanoregulaceae archaeon]HPD09566.1 FKBP-type peptidyl-prolyl cis-trans isomerase [Methanoregulaceae archaeon]HRT15237.1 FKBP-type peptidyl-prolyl cis-trans isomerase [Methanoregulaceae archaeon]HRU30808.1 FKBP-type peptidyl-prolyl cis-trans isomerase [Methanoregulaceae archaeon]
MPLEKGDFVSLSYTGSVAGAVFDTTDEEAAKDAGVHSPGALYGPVTIRIGSQHVILGLDEALEGREVGDEGEIDIPPEKAFGPREKEHIEAFNKNSFKEKPKVGITIKVPDRGEGTVVDIIGNRVLVDFNHPLAGKELHYWFRIETAVSDIVEKVKGLIRLFTGRDIEVAFNDGIVTITLPPGINYDRRWVLWRSRIVHEALEFIPEITEVNLVETFRRQEKEEL